MAQKNTTHVGVAYSIVVKTTMHTDYRKVRPCCGVFSLKQEKTHPQNHLESQVSMRVSSNRYYLKEDRHA